MPKYANIIMTLDTWSWVGLGICFVSFVLAMYVSSDRNVVINQIVKLKL